MGGFSSGGLVTAAAHRSQKRLYAASAIPHGPGQVAAPVMNWTGRCGCLVMARAPNGQVGRLTRITDRDARRARTGDPELAPRRSSPAIDRRCPSEPRAGRNRGAAFGSPGPLAAFAATRLQTPMGRGPITRTSSKNAVRCFFLLTVHAPFIIVAVLPGLDGPHYVPRPLHCG